MRTFGLVMLVGFGVLGTLSLLTWRRTGAEWRHVAGLLFLAIALVVFVWSLVAPTTLPPVYRAWMSFGQGIGAVVSTVLLTILYVLVVAPIGFIMRLTGTDPLDRRVTRDAASYWRAHEGRGSRDQYLHMS